MERFVTLIFRGARFENAAMPIPALSELMAYRDIVLAVARSLFLAENPDRLRLPRGFESGFALVMKGIEAGSTAPTIVRVPGPSAAPLVFAGKRDWFERARDLVEASIAAVAGHRELPAEFPLDVLPRFAAFGRSLADDESITVAQPDKQAGATYDRRVRKALVLRGQGTYEDEVSLVGEVRSADRDTETFALRLDDERKLEVRSPRAFFPLALESLRTAAPVRVRGTGLFDAVGTLLKVTMASDVSLAEEGDEQTRPGCATPVDAQLESLKALARGWYDEMSPEFDAERLDWLSKLLVALLDGFQLPRPYIYPTPEGLARAEWPGAKWEVISKFDLASREADVLAVRVDSEELHELTVPLGEPGAESKLGRFLQEHLCTNMPRELPSPIDDVEELLFRQVHPAFMRDGRPRQPGVLPDEEGQRRAFGGEGIGHNGGWGLPAPYGTTWPEVGRHVGGVSGRGSRTGADRLSRPDRRVHASTGGPGARLHRLQSPFE